MDSFYTVKRRIPVIKRICNKNTSFILVGNKCDLEKEGKRIISYEKGLELANEEKMDFFIEVSAKMSFNIDELFFEAAKIIYKKHI